MSNKLDLDFTAQVMSGLGVPFAEVFRLIVDRLQKADVQVESADALPSVVAQTERIENEMQRLEAQARVAQEMAIAARIQTAAEVQIEEFYEYGGAGKGGLGTDGSGLTLGVSGSGKRVSKRVYKFTGVLPTDAELIGAARVDHGKAHEEEVPASDAIKQ